MEANAKAFGAATIINAIGLGKGAAFGIDIWTQAKVQITDSKENIEVSIKNDPDENKELAIHTVQQVFDHFQISKGANIETESNIPIARGLKSSSVAANAIALATVTALGKRMPDLEIVKLGVEAAIQSNVTITGAFDDACASYYGGAVVTDNTAKKLLKRFKIEGDPHILLFIPDVKRYTIEVDVERLKKVSPLVKIAWEIAFKGDIWKALTLNGYLYSSEFNLNPEIALLALESGAMAAGLSGKGPATIAVVNVENVDTVKQTWSSFKGEIREVRINRTKAHTVQ
ncbi:shikimate kinase [[Eubacterium] cellulosolvens]